MENKVPPPIYMLSFGALAWLTDYLFPMQVGDDLSRQIVAVVLVLVAGLFLSSSLVSFIRQKTTVNPLQPEKASSLVISGVFRFSRNPMYLGMMLILMAWVLYLGNPLGAGFIVLFGVVINVWQIRPEEKFLLEKFGDQYAAYCRTVRRWI